MQLGIQKRARRCPSPTPSSIGGKPPSEVPGGLQFPVMPLKCGRLLEEALECRKIPMHTLECAHLDVAQSGSRQGNPDDPAELFGNPQEPAVRWYGLHGIRVAVPACPGRLKTSRTFHSSEWLSGERNATHRTETVGCNTCTYGACGGPAFILRDCRCCTDSFVTAGLHEIGSRPDA